MAKRRKHIELFPAYHPISDELIAEVSGILVHAGYGKYILALMCFATDIGIKIH
jgi:hypothetical protein